MTDDIPYLSLLFTFLRNVQVFNLIMLSVIPTVNITEMLRSLQPKVLPAVMGLVGGRVVNLVVRSRCQNECRLFFFSVGHFSVSSRED